MKKLLLFLLLPCMVGCGYHLAGTGTTLPPYIKKIYIPPIKNMTPRPEVESFFTAAIREEMIKRGKKVVDREEAADAELLGTIVAFRMVPVGITTTGEGRRFSIIITGKFYLKDLRTERVIFQSSSYTFRDEYQAEGSRGVNFLSLQSDAIDRIAKEFARSVVSTILEGF
jgi:outer membrane lipopolysaccharide assembly protein LptE/RlpB